MGKYYLSIFGSLNSLTNDEKSLYNNPHIWPSMWHKWPLEFEVGDPMS